MKSIISNGSTTLAKPFLRWAGGKKWLVNQLDSYIPEFTGRYYELFLGGGSIFFKLTPEKASLSDLNEELINTYEQVRDNVEGVIAGLTSLKHDKATYNRIKMGKPLGNPERAIRFIYLNRTAWNGLYRVNKKGEFNVPIGRHKYPAICDKNSLRNASKVLKGKSIKVADFERAAVFPRKGDFVYLDPPYASSSRSKENGFVEYNSQLFSMNDQERLAEVAKKMSQKGCYVLISNLNHSSIKELFKDFYIVELSRSSSIAGDPKQRGKIRELLLLNYEPTDKEYKNGSGS